MPFSKGSTSNGSWGWKSGVGSGISVPTPVAVPGVSHPFLLLTEEATAPGNGRGGFTFAYLVHSAGSFLYSRVRAAIFPLASAGISVSSNLQEAWSLQEAKEKEVQERWERSSGRQGQIPESTLQVLNLTKDIIKALCFWKLLWYLTRCLPASLLLSVPLSWASEDGIGMSPGG